MRSVSLVITARMRNAGNALSCALGHDTAPGHTYTVPLSPSGSGTPTHYGAHTWASDSFVALLTNAKRGTFPDGFSAGDLTRRQIAGAVGAIEAEVGEDPSTTWPALLARLGLKLIEVE